MLVPVLCFTKAFKRRNERQCSRLVLTSLSHSDTSLNYQLSLKEKRIQNQTIDGNYQLHFVGFQSNEYTNEKSMEEASKNEHGNNLDLRVGSKTAPPKPALSLCSYCTLLLFHCRAFPLRHSLVLLVIK